jgi:hypothetical protein
VSIVLQSFASSAASIENHQVDIEHLQSVHVHTNDNASEETDNADHDIKDCHHCGHCSASHSVWMTVRNSIEFISFNIIETSIFLVKSPSKLIETTFRPPIAYLA